MIHEILPVGILQCNCSIFGDEASREAIVIDPGDDVEEIVNILNRHGLTVKAIVITHAHIDHVAGAAKLRGLTQAPVYMNERDISLLNMLKAQATWLNVPPPEQTTVDAPASEGQILKLGPVEFEILDTPGHTEGSISIWIPAENKLIAGDTLFRESIGRTDLPGGDSRKILSSIRSKLFALPDDVLVIPGHGDTTTIGHEKQRNPFLRGL
ncbi:MAG: MBL fold metallo-hydrolase [Acidobacteriaceae bacterium]|nr:MBL fold metallo-hydrolase [Acidobacteriaceae bacterium]